MASFYYKRNLMAHNQSDPGRTKTESTNIQRDEAAKGGPVTGLGDPSNRKAPSADGRQVRGAASSADNDEDRVAEQQSLNLQKDADEAQSDGDLSFPEGK
jgi:hypothetical protein